jgi:hypothetical protein
VVPSERAEYAAHRVSVRTLRLFDVLNEFAYSYVVALEALNPREVRALMLSAK